MEESSRQSPGSWNVKKGAALNTTTTSKTYRPTATSDEFFQVLRAELLRLDGLYFLLQQTNEVTDCFFRNKNRRHYLMRKMIRNDHYTQSD